jgi:hypothetical protein
MQMQKSISFRITLKGQCPSISRLPHAPDKYIFLNWATFPASRHTFTGHAPVSLYTFNIQLYGSGRKLPFEVEKLGAAYGVQNMCPQGVEQMLTGSVALQSGHVKLGMRMMIELFADSDECWDELSDTSELACGIVCQQLFGIVGSQISHSKNQIIFIVTRVLEISEFLLILEVTFIIIFPGLIALVSTLPPI